MARFSVTEIQQYRRCRQQWEFASKSRRNLTTAGSGPEPLELGGLVHRALADWMILPKEAQTEAGVLPMLFLKNANARKEELKETYETEKNQKLPEMYLDSLMNVVRLGTHMMNNYQLFHETPIPVNMRVAFPEQEIEVPVPGTAHYCKACLWWNQERKQVVLYSDEVISPANPDCKDCGGTGTCFHYLTATLDGLLQDEDDYLWVLEHKTYENRPKLMDLFMNYQFTGYAWVVRELKIGKIGGIAYDGMWKREIPPKYLQKEKRAGRIDDLFIRKSIPKSDHMLDWFGQNLTKEVNEMANNPPIYLNIPWQGCSDCMFQDPCYMMMNGEDNSNYIKNMFTQREIIRGGREK